MTKKKKKKKDYNDMYNIKKDTLILIMLICIIIAMITYWIYAYHHKYGDFYFEEVKLVKYKINDYIDTKGSLVYLKNVNENVMSDFINKQQNIINNNNIISVDITKGIHKDILSVMISYTIQDGNTNYEELLTLNIDLKNDKQLNNDELLNRVNISYKEISKIIFNEHIKLANDSNKIVIDAITDKELTSKEFNENSEKYIIRIREKLPEVMKIYIDDNTVYMLVRLSEIDKVCYYTNEVNRLVNIKKEIGKI